MLTLLKCINMIIYLKNVGILSYAAAAALGFGVLLNGLMGAAQKFA